MEWITIGKSGTTTRAGAAPQPRRRGEDQRRGICSPSAIRAPDQRPEQGKQRQRLRDERGNDCDEDRHAAASVGRLRDAEAASSCSVAKLASANDSHISDGMESR